MGSSPSVLANLYMICFETERIHISTNKPKLWVGYVDDIFMISSHIQKELRKFVMKSQYHKIQFTLLDSLVSKHQPTNICKMQITHIELQK